MRKGIILENWDFGNLITALTLDYFNLDANDLEYNERYLLYLEHKYKNKDIKLKDSTILITHDDLVNEIYNSLSKYFNIYKDKKDILRISRWITFDNKYPIQRLTLGKAPYDSSNLIKGRTKAYNVICIAREPEYLKTDLERIPTREELFEEFDGKERSKLKNNTNNLIKELYRERNTDIDEELKEVLPNLLDILKKQ